jgi:LCP family protein required for cell wall assembly
MSDPRRPRPTRATPPGPARPWWEEDLERTTPPPVRSHSPWAEELARSTSTGGRRGGNQLTAPHRTQPHARSDRGIPGPGGRGPGYPPPAGRTRRGPSPARRRRLRRTLLLVVAGLTVLGLVVGGLVYTHLNGNLRSDPLFGGLTGNAGTEKADPFGRSPINVLLIGSDTRATAADCQIGGGCANGGAGANADVEMVVHVSADRSNATVVSVPRDLVTDLPACRSPKGQQSPAHVGQINSTLEYGPGCTVAAVHQLTGIPIDHFVMVDFSGVVAMSDAIGGAQVCVSGNVYDTYSRLKLAKGTHTLKGLAALEFVRSRHAFGDGSDLGRTYAQHQFLSAVIRNLKSAGTLANPATLYSLADAATKALTVDTGLASIPRLVGLATDLNKVPTHRITFTTMQNQPDPANPARVVIAPGAKQLFASIAADQALTSAQPAGSPSTPASGAAAGHASPSPTTPAASGSAAPKDRIAVRVENGSGRSGRASSVARALIDQGFSSRTSSGTAPTDTATTTLAFGPGRQADAQVVAAALGLPASALRPGTGSAITLTIGTDWPTGTTFGGTPKPAPVDTAAALNQAHAQTADTSGSCTPVSTQATVLLNGVPMSPADAFRLSPDVPVSAP